MKIKSSRQILIVISIVLCGILSILFLLNINNISLEDILIVILSLCCSCVVGLIFAIRKIHSDRNDDSTDQLLDLVYFLEKYDVTEKNKEIYDFYVNEMIAGKTAPIILRSKLKRLLEKRGYRNNSNQLALSDTINSYYYVIGFSLVSFGWCCAFLCAIRLLVTLHPISVLFWIGLIIAAIGYIYYAIHNVSKNNNSALFASLISCLIIVGVCFVSGTVRANHVNSTCKDIHVSIVEKCESNEKSMYVDGYVTEFKIKVTNEKFKTIILLKGNLSIYDKNGELLDASIVTLSGDILSGDSTTFTLNIDRRSSEKIIKLYYATAKELSATFKISEMIFEGYSREEYPDSRLMEILSLDEGAENDSNTDKTIEEKYMSATAFYENGNYNEAIAIFEQMINYKDSANYISLCELVLENAVKESIYTEAVSLYKSGSYSEAIRKFEEILDYKDSSDYIEKCENAISLQDIEKKYVAAKAMYQNKQYSNAYYAFYEIMDYKDSQDIMTAIVDEVEALSIEYANNGDYQNAYNLLSDMGYSTSDNNVNYLPILKAYNYAQYGDYRSAIQHGLTKIVLPAETTEIGSSMFDGCSELVEIVMPDTVTSVGSYAFSGCKRLEKLILSPNIESIGRSAFSNCDALDKLFLPLSLKYIVTYGLNSIDGEIYYEGTISQWAQVEKESGGSALSKTIHCSDGDIQP